MSDPRYPIGPFEAPATIDEGLRRDLIAQIELAPSQLRRAVAGLDARELAALSPADYQRLVPGTALARAGYDGLRRNAAYALGAARDRRAREVLERLAEDPSSVVSDAARWALARLSPS